MEKQWPYQVILMFLLAYAPCMESRELPTFGFNIDGKCTNRYTVSYMQRVGLVVTFYSSFPWTPKP